MSREAFGLGGFDHLVYVRVFEGCNVHCKHCFIPNNPKRMSTDQLLVVPDAFSRFAKEGQHIHIQWHGGEPTLLGPDILRLAMDNWRYRYPQYRFTFGIQTNLTTLNEQWIALFQSHFDGHVGVSWDTDIRSLKSAGANGNEAYESLFWSNLDLLVAAGISPYLVMTGTRNFFQRFAYPPILFDMLTARGIKSAHIERLTRTGYANDSWGEIGLSNLEYSQYMTTFARSYAMYLKLGHDSDRPPLRLSPFDDLFESLRGLSEGRSGGAGCLSGVCDTRFHTIDANGYQKGCTALTVDGEISSDVALVKLVDFAEVRADRQLSCEGCEFRPICSSGCLGVPKEDESGECSGGRTLFANARQLI